MLSRIQPALRRMQAQHVGAGVVGFAVGFGLGLYLNRRGEIEAVIEPESYLDEEEFIVDEEELEDDFFSPEADGNIVLNPPPNDPRLIAVDLDALHRRDELISIHGFTRGMELYQAEYSKGTEIPTEEDEENVINIFSSEDSTWDQEAEEAARESSDGPYILHKDEFYADERDYTQTTLTYYAGDNMLTDQEEQPVYNYQAITGELKFGHGSGDSNVVFVRNEKLKAEYEIILDPGHYSVEVLGLEADAQQERDELKHSIRRFRMDD